MERSPGCPTMLRRWKVRSRYERLEEIGWIVGFAVNLSDVEYRLTAAGKTQLNRMRF
jgi:hypothetical protein